MKPYEIDGGEISVDATTGFSVNDRRMTGREAADHFAATAFETPRKVGQWRGRRFRLAGGCKWYVVLMTPGNAGWRIVEETATQPERADQ